MDLKNILNDESEKDESESSGSSGKERYKDNNIRVHKKPVQLRDIENRSSNNREQSVTQSDENMRYLLEKEKEEIYKNSWNKLDIGLKINRIKLFINEDSKDKGINKTNLDNIITTLINICKEGNISKNSDVVYNVEFGKIISIKILNYDEKNKKYKISKPEKKKTKSVSGNKSKSNIERFLKN